MPAINPSALAEKIDSIFADKLAVNSFPREIHALLSFYADRTRRSSAVAAARDVGETMRVPAPVLRALCTKIHQRGRRQDDDWLLAANQLWSSNLREMRQVSICMLREAPIHLALETATSWAAECEDPEVLWALASEGLSTWRQAQPEELLESSQRWIAHELDSVSTLGVMALLPLIEMESFNDLPSVLALLVGLTSDARGLRQEALGEVLKALAERSPAETAAFLQSEVQPGGLRTARLIRSILDAFPATLQAELRGML